MLNEVLTTIASLALNLFVITSMLAMGMNLTVKQILDPLRNVRLVVLALVGNFILVPALAWGLTAVLPMGQPQATALILLGTCAGAPFLPKLAQMSKGNLALSVGLMVMLMVVTIFYAPLVLPVILPGAQVDVAAIAQSLILLMLLPLAIGLLVKWRYAETAVSWQPHMSQASTYSLLLLIAASLLLQFRNILGAIGSWLILGTLILTVGALVIGYFLSAGSEAADRKVAALGTGQRNLSAALVVGASFGDSETLVMTLVASLILAVILIVMGGEIGKREAVRSSSVPGIPQ
ncbi:MAG: bile acid:sodium symporter [Ardenticatenaceae bacterium]|nr:bile acid:sodium symporter [Anaerolineales bacterium]MCB8984337.1 bile acid:sodium symporter [Ardenticatenaceae bacterium]MCB8988720.1 bile acid:sodium symporter [Ardenticatenaceae bacterium]